MTQDALFGIPDGWVAADKPGHHRAKPADPFTAALPEWLAAGLDALNPSGRSAYARLVPCPRCRAPVLNGPNVQDGGVDDVTADPAVIGPEDELAVLLGGGYAVEVEVRRYGAGIVLYRRDRWLMQRPPSTRRRFAAPSHRCGVSAGHPAPWAMLFSNAPNHHERSHHEQPPF